MRTTTNSYYQPATNVGTRVDLGNSYNQAYTSGNTAVNFGQTGTIVNRTSAYPPVNNNFITYDNRLSSPHSNKQCISDLN